MPTLIDRHLKVPKYLQMAEYLRQQIADGALMPGDQLPSFSEMKLQFEAAQHTVEKAHGLLEADGLIRREPGRGIFVNQPKSQAKTSSVGFMTGTNMHRKIDLLYWGLILAGMRQVASSRDYQLLLIDNAITFDNWEKIDGVVLCNTIDPSDPYPALPQPPKNSPCVSIINEMAGMACISLNEFDGAYQLASHLIELGHRRIAYLGNFDLEVSQMVERKEGYFQALRDAGIEPDLRYMRAMPWRDVWRNLPTCHYLAGEYYAQRWIEEDWADLGCTALMAQNDDVARGAIAAFAAAGWQVPRDLNVTGFDGLETANQAPQLTTVQVPLFDLGQQAMTSLLDRLADPTNIPQSIRMSVKLIKGQTTAGVLEAAVVAQ